MLVTFLLEFMFACIGVQLFKVTGSHDGHVTQVALGDLHIAVWIS